MTANDLLGLILLDSQRIATAISTGAQWEIWMQVELAVLFRDAGFQVAREVPYPPPVDSLRLDLLAQDPGGSRYAIEMKVESATNSGLTIVAGLENDLVKIGRYNVEGLTEKWVVGVAYSAVAKERFRDLALRYPSMIIVGESDDVGVIVISATPLLAQF
jgi:hypothetical protein